MRTLLVSSDAQFNVEHNYLLCDKTELVLRSYDMLSTAMWVGLFGYNHRVCMEIPIYSNYPITQIARFIIFRIIIIVFILCGLRFTSSVHYHNIPWQPASCYVRVPLKGKGHAFFGI